MENTIYSNTRAGNNISKIPRLQDVHAFLILPLSPIFATDHFGVFADAQRVIASIVSVNVC